MIGDGRLVSVAAMTSLTRGRLPARVYWVRRILVLGVALLLVVGVAKLLGAGSDASSKPDQAAQVSAEQSSAPANPQRGTKAQKNKKAKKKAGKKKRKPEPVLATPSGTCRGEDIAVTPEVPESVAGRDVRVVLQLRTLTSPACYWQVSPYSLQVNITSGKDEIWSSRHCKRAVPRARVVVRSAQATSVELIWNAKRSDQECSKLTDWAMPGYYHVNAAALAGEPGDVQFELEQPSGPVITRSPEPKKNDKAKDRNRKKNRNGGRPVTQQR